MHMSHHDSSILSIVKRLAIPGPPQPKAIREYARRDWMNQAAAIESPSPEWRPENQPSGDWRSRVSRNLTKWD
jgi:hypothetical protein